MDELLRWAQTATVEELRAKIEELAGALARIETRIYQAQLQFERRWGEAKRNEAFRLTNEARKIVEDALHAPGGGDR